MSTRSHTYHVDLEWTGNLGEGTSGHAAYSRDYVMRIKGKPDLRGTSDPAYKGDPARHNPEDLLVASLSGCHMLWYLGLCAGHGVQVTAYSDAAEGVMVPRTSDGGEGRFTEVTLRPRVVIASGSEAVALSLHQNAHDKCFVANSVNFPIRVEPTIETAADGDAGA